MAIVPVLKRFDIYVYKDKTGTDKAQVPASATINFYRQGATVRTAVTVPVQTEPPSPPTAVAVYYTGPLQVGDFLWVNADPAKDLIVGDLSTDPQIALLFNGTGSPLALTVGQRLVNTTDMAKIYSDPLGTVEVGTSIQTDANTGRASGYIRAYRYDYTVVITGQATRVFIDAEGSFVMR